MNTHPRTNLVSSVLTLAALCGLSVLSGCVTGKATPEPAPLPEVTTLLIFNGETGEQVAWEAMMSEVNASDVVVIGELHGHPVGLHAAATLWEEVAAAHESAALSMEFFERDEQIGLDDYLNGVLDNEKFRKATRRSDGNYPPGHERMIEKAKELHRPVYAANSPRRYNSLANHEGYDRLRQLTPEQQRLFVIPDALPEGRYRDAFFEIMTGMPADHGAPTAEAESEPADDKPAADETAETMADTVTETAADMTDAPATQPDEPTTQPETPTTQPDAAAADDTAGQTPDGEEEAPELTPEQEESLISIFRSQCMWDSTMSDSILKASDAGHRPVVHVVGQFHVNFGGGIPIRLAALAPELKIVTVCVSSEWSDSLTEDDNGKADYVIYVGPSE